jgi:hypothetical protein
MKDLDNLVGKNDSFDAVLFPWKVHIRPLSLSLSPSLSLPLSLSLSPSLCAPPRFVCINVCTLHLDQ